VRRVVIISDLHAGHHAGICPPSHWLPESSPGRLGDFAQQQRALWNWYVGRLLELQPIDTLIVNGDAIDGKGSRSGGTELLTTDLKQQCNIAASVIRVAQADNIRIVAGTPYHSSPDGEDWEDVLADMVGGTMMGRRFLEVDGVVFDIKHKVGSSSVPHGRHTAISKERVWNVLWHEREGAPKADVIIRSHVHYHEYSGNPTHLAMTTPALQGWGSKYGERQCSGIVDIGFVHFDVEDGAYSWQAHLFKPRVELLEVA
jgi:hypothetical protein